MPYKIVKAGKGFKVVKATTGKAFSKKPQTHAKAVAQLRAIEVNTKGK